MGNIKIFTILFFTKNSALTRLISVQDVKSFSHIDRNSQKLNSNLAIHLEKSKDV